MKGLYFENLLFPWISTKLYSLWTINPWPFWGSNQSHLNNIIFMHLILKIMVFQLYNFYQCAKVITLKAIIVYSLYTHLTIHYSFIWAIVMFVKLVTIDIVLCPHMNFSTWTKHYILQMTICNTIGRIKYLIKSRNSKVVELMCNY